MKFALILILSFIFLSNFAIAAESVSRTIFVNPEKFVLYANILKCDEREKDSVPCSKWFKSIPDQLKFFIESFYAVPDPKDSIGRQFGRNGQKVEFIEEADAFGEKALRYKDNPNIVFLSIGATYIPETSGNYYVSVLVKASRYGENISPFLTTSISCTINPKLTDTEKSNNLRDCFRQIEPRFISID